ncbi:MAG TPA: hypothetical protein VEQ63_07845, partial [Bryobacteraceae bacterium]|nr:hypothetical protein [Bryobacteraceae bacterium]
EESKCSFVILRPNWFMDNFHTIWLAPIQEAGILPLPAAEGRASFIDSRDVAACAAAALRNDGLSRRTFALTGPEALTHGEAASVISSAAGREIAYVPVDDVSFMNSLVETGVSASYAAYITGLFRWTRSGAAARVTTDVQELIGRAPRTLSEYVQDHAGEWR